MKGAIIGDIAGSIYEFDETAESLDFPLFVKNSRFTDDTVTTVAVAAALMEEGILLRLYRTLAAPAPLLVPEISRRRFWRPVPPLVPGRRGTGLRQLWQWGGYARQPGWLDCRYSGGSPGAGRADSRRQP